MKLFHTISLLSIMLLNAAIADHPDEAVQIGFSQPELDQMLAPIALYPDILLSQVLMAATYPLEVVEASRWSQSHPTLEGDDAVLAVEDQNWDASVKALTAFPDLIQLMDENLTWTRQLGDAFLAQEEQVMETVQQLRQRAMEEGNLDSLDNLVIEQQEDVIIIEPADVRTVYVPYYQTRYVYGDWWWYDYPPYYWDPPYYYSGIGFSWSRGFRVSTHFYFSHCDWHHRSIVIHRRYPSHSRYDFRRHDSHYKHSGDSYVWRHNPYHRRGVRYHDEDLERKYQKPDRSINDSSDTRLRKYSDGRIISSSGAGDRTDRDSRHGTRPDSVKPPERPQPGKRDTGSSYTKSISSNKDLRSSSGRAVVTNGNASRIQAPQRIATIKNDGNSKRTSSIKPRTTSGTTATRMQQSSSSTRISRAETASRTPPQARQARTSPPPARQAPPPSAKSQTSNSSYHSSESSRSSSGYASNSKSIPRTSIRQSSQPTAKKFSSRSDK